MIPLRGLLILFAMGLAGCGGPAEPRWAADAELAKHRYRPATGPELRLYTVVSTQNGSGAHSALLITTPEERILFDPAGSFELHFTPERNDVLYGMTPRALAVYIDYHARETYDVVEQTMPVSAAQARRVAALAKSYGPVPKAQCSVSINRILGQVPGFETMRVTYFPRTTERQFGALPGVETRLISDDDADRNHGVLIRARGR